MSRSESDESNNNIDEDLLFSRRSRIGEAFDDSDEEEEECRVCRGPAEEGRPLFKPCKCSGSIGLTHQDCLTSWLDVTRGGGKCELCSTRFQFAPRYAPGAPDRLPTRQVCLRILRRAGAKWLPFALRFFLSISLWLVVLPLSTSYIYHSWMHRPVGIKERWEWELIKRDTVGGGVIALVIVVSFLSLMSFAEFLRFHWNGNNNGIDGNNGIRNNIGQRVGADGQGWRNDINGNGGNLGGARRDDTPPREDEIDDIVLRDSYYEDGLVANVNLDKVGGESRRRDLLRDLVKKMGNENEASFDELLQNQYLSGDESNSSGDRENSNGSDEAENQHCNEIMAINSPDNSIENDDYIGVNMDNFPRFILNDEEEMEALIRVQEEQEMDREREQPAPPQPGIRPIPRPRNDARFEPQFEPLQPAFDFEQDDLDDGVDMEINMGLDELLGFRGPLFAVVRNLLWFLVFNTAYLGVFAFMPSTIGSSIFSLLANNTSLESFVNNTNSSQAELSVGSFMSAVYELEQRSKDTKSVFQPSEIAKIGLGYSSFACFIFFTTEVVALLTRSRNSSNKQGIRENDRRNGRANEPDFIPIEDEHIFNRNDGIRRHLRQLDVNRNEARDTFGDAVLSFLECASAIAKVVMLLFIKMLFLPLLLGIWLDIATISLFEKTIHDRFMFAGDDLFGFIFLHWVAGITFMLLVTVSVLQLREVAHPDILAGVIRPQEPQPDLLGNLLQESGLTHAKRILLSLGIYAALLTIHIWIPSKLLASFNVGRLLPFFHPKLRNFIMPQIQVPLELFIFHLCMLGFLEKYKNNIGGMQHHWLVLVGNLLGLVDKILPREVEKFVLVGTLPVYAADEHRGDISINKDIGKIGSHDLDPFWDEILSSTNSSKREDTIRLKVRSLEMPASPTFSEGSSLGDGRKVLSSHRFMRFPTTSTDVSKQWSTSKSNLLPTCIGPYRLKQRISKRISWNTPIPGIKPRPRIISIPLIEIWKEVPGKPIPRPPEGWDDLGAGGAESQGRWAWGDERLSNVESSVAVRTPFIDEYATGPLLKTRVIAELVAKMAVLLLISWLAITVALCAAMNVPLYIGHFAMYLLRVHDEYSHDPISFAVGAGFIGAFFGIVNKLHSVSTNCENNIVDAARDWLNLLQPHHSREKLRTIVTFVILWTFICPLLLGCTYGNFFAGPRVSWKNWKWSYEMQNLLLQWGTGMLLLNSWAALCYFRVFTKEFWVAIAMGEGNVNDNNNQDNPVGAEIRRMAEVNNLRGNAAGHVNDAQRRNNESDDKANFGWQGKNGAIGLSFKAVCNFFTSWEWDKIDRKAMLDNCVFPIAKHLAMACLIPSLLTLLSPSTGLTPSQDLMDGPSMRATFRVLAVTSVFMQLLHSKRDGLGHWYEAAHKIARDDQYLIGEILLNHTPTGTQTR